MTFSDIKPENMCNKQLEEEEGHHLVWSLSLCLLVPSPSKMRMNMMYFNS